MQTYTHELVVMVNKISPALVSIAKPREGGRTSSVSATRLWNQIPIKLKKWATTVASFRKAFHRHLLTSYDEVEHFSPNVI